MKSKAFTLAEVLITLSIIGVVAVLTISPLITSYKEKAMVVKLKKSYVELENATRLIIMRKGKAKSCDYRNEDGTIALCSSTYQGIACTCKVLEEGTIDY